eukprot:CAMPEP_0172918890 /NCGR_PEP_ID=MMETSP1075-20121228/201056_1 /TAXON_ID=2916 /ORGANISM="Ceratium fusus, Strain PA161109" /LENGTH=94 /DNA_ID=CAMNT_0013778631 /DNA_START=130 /DNA_END=410 /DNA_ORIENTATION=-
MDIKRTALWGVKVAGIDTGDGWVEMNDGLYLPMYVDGFRVLFPTGIQHTLDEGRRPARRTLADVWDRIYKHGKSDDPPPKPIDQGLASLIAELR